MHRQPPPPLSPNPWTTASYQLDNVAPYQTASSLRVSLRLRLARMGRRISKCQHLLFLFFRKQTTCVALLKCHFWIFLRPEELSFVLRIYEIEMLLRCGGGWVGAFGGMILLGFFFFLSCFDFDVVF
jgi:hypothetical protein